MCWLLFMDESGHDHRQMPYEVRGGCALSSRELWPFTQGLRALELHSFGIELSELGKEFKGSKLLDKSRFKWANQREQMEDEQRRRHCRRFLTLSQQRKPLMRDDFTAYGQACLEMATGVFELLERHNARIFASAIPRGAMLPPSSNDLLRKDHVYLLERFYRFLEGEQQEGVLIFDEIDKSADRRFVSRLQRYFIRTAKGRYRSRWVTPMPLFVASDMAKLVQVADLVIYAINHGFRLPERGMDADAREEIVDRYADWIARLQHRSRVVERDQEFVSYSIVFVDDLLGTASTR